MTINTYKYAFKGLEMYLETGTGKKIIALQTKKLYTFVFPKQNKIEILYNYVTFVYKIF